MFKAVDVLVLWQAMFQLFSVSQCTDFVHTQTCPNSEVPALKLIFARKGPQTLRAKMVQAQAFVTVSANY